jgi:hypothetical protein
LGGSSTHLTTQNKCEFDIFDFIQITLLSTGIRVRQRISCERKVERKPAFLWKPVYVNYYQGKSKIIELTLTSDPSLYRVTNSNRFDGCETAYYIQKVI